MSKLKKLMVLALSLCASAVLAVACGKSGGGNESSSSQEQSSSTETSSSESSSASSEEESNSQAGGESSSEEVHVCITDGDWKKNSTGHWLKCTCGKTVGYGSHVGEAETCGELAVCDVCGKEFGDPKAHSYGEMTDGAEGWAYYCDCGDFVTNADLVDFVVKVESGREPVVLQLSDTQIMNYGSLEELCYKYVREVVQETKPDLIILTGDVVYGKFDPKGALLRNFINFMETLKTPWAPVFGNHDNESLMGVDWQCDQFEAAEYCLFKQGDLTGNGNYTVGIEQDGELLRVFYMMDSNGCGYPMIDENGVATKPAAGTNEVYTGVGFGSDQILWLEEDIANIKSFDENVKFSLAYHIQQAIFGKAFQKYEEYDNTLVAGSSSALKYPLNLDSLETADDTDFGYIGRTLKGPWDNNNAIFYKMKGWGIDSIFVGHEHCNSASIVYEGVRLQFGQKSSEYDRFNVLTIDGRITSNQEGVGTSLMGGTVIPVSSEDGSIGTGYIAYYGDPFGTESEGESGSTDSGSSESGSTDSGSSETPAIVVEGLQYGTDLTAQSDAGANYGSVQAVTYEGVNAYYIVSGTAYNRMYINVALLRGKTTVSFDIFVPEEATTTAGAATQEFAIRVKPNQTEETMPGVASGYLWFDASYTNERKVLIGEWQTITIDISGFADVCTEFGIYFVEGNNGAYIKNVAVS